MGRKRRQPQSESAHPTPTEATNFQHFEFVADEYGGTTVMRDGHPQSHVDLDNPQRIEFEYVQHFAMAIDTLSPNPPEPLGITHIGGAGLTLARYVEATRPGSAQIVLEPDVALTEAVRQHLPLPRGHRIRVRPQLGEVGVVELKDASADVIVLDAFADGQVPAPLVSPTCFAHVERVLKPGGAFLANLPDEPGLQWISRVAATLNQHVPVQIALASQEIWKGRRFGNVVLAASTSDDTFDLPQLRRLAAKAIFPTAVRAGQELDALRRGLVFTDESAEKSPVPPALGAWRVK